MKYLIDLQSLQTTSANRGIGRYSKAITEAILKKNPDDEFFLLLNDSNKKSDNKILEEICSLVNKSHIVKFPLPQIHNSAIYLNNEEVQLAKIIRERYIEAIKPDVVLITSLFEFEAISTIVERDQRSYFCAVILYDLIPLANPKIYLGNATLNNWYQDRLAQLKEADAVLAISNYVKSDAIERINLPSELCCNISAASNLHEPSENIVVENIATPPEKNFILYVGGFDKRKNVDKLIKSYSKISSKLKEKYQLKLAGGIQDFRKVELQKYTRSQGLKNGEVEFTGYIEDSKLIEIYKQASLFVFPSSDEGFGLPPLEAMGFGVPTIVSDCASLPEVVGNQEALFNIDSTSDLTNKIESVLKDEVLRNRLKVSGLEQSKKFSWEKSAAQALEFIHNKMSSTKLGDCLQFNSFKDFLIQISSKNCQIVYSGDENKLANLLARALYEATKIQKLTQEMNLPEELRIKEYFEQNIPDYMGFNSPYVFSSGLCREQHFHMPLYSYWCKKLLEKPKFHRKQWEFVFICQTLYERGFLKSGKSGVGFGVGREPLVAYFASQGAEVLATDLDFSKAEELGWVTTDQHSNNLSALNEDGICDPVEFNRLAKFKNVDMNAIPEDIGKYDFCWSSCAFEHLGSIRRGLDFVKNSARLLKPGGVAVHTTEFNLSSNFKTLDNNPHFVIFRRCDIELLEQELSSEGLIVEAIDYSSGEDQLERYVDMPPYIDEPHLRLQLAGEYTSTSIGIIIHAPL